ncbi:hypothetical protein ASF17_14160 [Frigoribacterium sp. Leaf263]|uniref:alpha/beta hydrolase n=1 Tax=Frigoribacterium sp. Leaf263 TaxID=1736313 RepID=UPI0006FBACD7|nr:alpha/beta hydrolase [Frigoribacterium sp. Leaf263]KQO80440.1 hypothetical protein ASF17_14160 [Frigoribacterium sp. Leaf263]
MPVDPFLTPLLPTPHLPEIHDFAAWRATEEANADAFVSQLIEEAPTDVRSHTAVIAVADGGMIELGIFRPDNEDVLPAHLYLHGGGWIAGSALSQSTSTIAKERAIGANCVVITVNYRKAPEHPYPAALLDCQAAFEWVITHADELLVDATCITLGGGSAGGNLAAALAMKIHDENGPAIALQLLEVPSLDLTLSQPSHSDRDLGTNYALHAEDTQRMIGLYLGPDQDPAARYASPLLAEDVSGVAPAYIMTAEFDMLRDDGALYADKLRRSGVPATHSLQIGHIHASSAFTRVMEGARRWRGEAINALNHAHAEERP